MTRVAVLGLLFGCLALSAGAVTADERPNILLIMCDDMGFSDIGSYGGEIETPNLDRLAEEGLRFRTFYNNAKCEHTRASLLTGRWWHHVGASPTVEYAAETFGERLRAAGYRTLMSGKWHAGQTPYERGFDRYYGLTDGCCNFWNPGHARPGEPEPAKKKVRRWAIDDQKFLPFTPKDKDFYTTDVFTDYAVDYLEEYRDETKPFLLYLAYTAPHYPLHASEKDVMRYRGKYMKGWDALRQERFARQQQLGILPANATLSPRDPAVPAWQSTNIEDRDWWDLRMATYAAMIDRLDRNIGRVMDKLESIGKLENTLVLFFSDNGACADSKDRSTVKGSMPWEVTSYLTQGKPWANASNTPYRMYKTTDFEGGTRTACIARWPKAIQPGSITDEVGHLVDIMPTMLDLAKAPVTPELDGHSLKPVFKGQEVQRPWPIFWQFGKSRAMRDGSWKLVRDGQREWELYNLASDPTEQDDMSNTETDRKARMIAAWEAWWTSKPD